MDARALEFLELWNIDLCTIANSNDKYIFCYFQVPVQLVVAIEQVSCSEWHLTARRPASPLLLPLSWEKECEWNG